MFKSKSFYCDVQFVIFVFSNDSKTILNSVYQWSVWSKNLKKMP